jgi:hypothetical protein
MHAENPGKTRKTAGQTAETQRHQTTMSGALGQPGKPKSRWWPDASTPRGAVLYAAIGGLLVWLLVNVLPHIHISITWR